jgi:hypothetical protein
MRPSILGETATGWLITQRSQVRILSPLLRDVVDISMASTLKWSLGPSAPVALKIPFDVVVA